MKGLSYWTQMLMRNADGKDKYLVKMLYPASSGLLPLMLRIFFFCFCSKWRLAVMP